MIEIQIEMRSVTTGRCTPINLRKGVLIKQRLDLEDVFQAGMMDQDKILIMSAGDSRGTGGLHLVVLQKQ